MSATPTAAVAILEFGRLLYEQNNKHAADRDVFSVQAAEENLLGLLQTDGHAKTAFAFDAGTPVDPLIVRILSFLAFVELCSNRLGVTVSDVVRAVTNGEPAAILEGRQTVNRLIFNHLLILVHDTTQEVRLGQRFLESLSGGSSGPPVVVTEAWLQSHWRLQADVTARRKRSQRPSMKVPTAKQLASKINEQVVGLDAQVRTLASRLTLHMQRASLIRAGRGPGTPNECLLFIGPSGCGKTWTAESVGKISGVPFGSISSGDLTSEAYVGLSIQDCFRPLITAARGDLEIARTGVIFVDEWDKKAATANTPWRDAGGTCVQAEMLRAMEGCAIQIGGRRGGTEQGSPVMFDSRGVMFLFGGAFVGLDKLLLKRSQGMIGFSNGDHRSCQGADLLDGLERYGLLPEYLTRLTGVLVFEAPSVEQLATIATRSVLPAFNRLLLTLGAEIALEADAVRLVAEFTKDSATFARGVKSVVSRLVEEIVFDELKGTVTISVAKAREAINAVAHGATTEYVNA